MTACHWLGFIRMTRPSWVIPALLIRTSQVPYSSTIVLNMALMLSGSEPFVICCIFNDSITYSRAVTLKSTRG